MSLTNKEVMDKLQEYFLKQDPKTVARLASSLMIDINRLWSVSKLEEKELQCLIFRMEKICEELKKFMEKGPSGDLKLVNMNSEDK